MKTLITPSYTDFIIQYSKKVKPNTKTTGRDDGNVYPLVNVVENVKFYMPNGRDESGNIVGGYSEVFISRIDVLELASKIKYIESQYVADGPDPYKDDLPF